MTFFMNASSVKLRCVEPVTAKARHASFFATGDPTESGRKHQEISPIRSAIAGRARAMRARAHEVLTFESTVLLLPRHYGLDSLSDPPS